MVVTPEMVLYSVVVFCVVAATVVGYLIGRNETRGAHRG